MGSGASQQPQTTQTATRNTTAAAVPQVTQTYPVNVHQTTSSYTGHQPTVVYGVQYTPQYTPAHHVQTQQYGGQQNVQWEHQSPHSGYPPVVHPATKKEQVFQEADYTEIDTSAGKIPIEFTHESYEILADRITNGLQTDVQRLRALFIWMTSLDIDSLDQLLSRLPDHGTPAEYLLRIKWKMGNHAHFFAQLTHAAGIPCVVVSGINKSAAYQLGESVQRPGMRAQWNAAHVGGGWRLLDVYWASAVVVGRKSQQWALIHEDGREEDDLEEQEGETIHVTNESFFVADPDQMSCTHFPDNPAWQLLVNPITVKTFEKFVYIRERFFMLNMHMLPKSHTSCCIKSKHGHAEVKFAIDPTQAVDSQYNYLLYRSRQAGEKAPNAPYERFVIYQKNANSISYMIRFPVVGRFKLDIFGQNTKKHATLDLVCSYLIYCDRAQDVEPLPACPSIGWGPGPELRQVGLQPTSHQNAIIDAENGAVEIRFTMDNPLTALQSLKHNLLDEWLLNRYAMIRTEGNQLVLNVRFPTSGEFALEMFADKEGAEGILPNVCNYLIRNLNAEVTAAPYPRFHAGMLGKSQLSDTFGVWPVSHTGNMISTAQEHVSVVFESNNNDIEILCELQNNSVTQQDLSSCALKSTNGMQTVFDIGLPKPGEYALNIYARKHGTNNQLYHIHSYLLDSAQQITYNEGTQQEVQPTVSLETDTSQLQLVVPSTSENMTANLTRNNAQDQPSSDQVKVTDVEDGKRIEVKLPHQGEYTLEVFENKAEGILEHVSTYHLARRQGDEESKYQEPAKQKNLTKEEVDKLQQEKELAAKYKAQRDKLRTAISRKDIGLLDEAIREYGASGAPDIKGELAKAKNLLQFLKLDQALTSAMGRRNLQVLQQVVADVEKAGLQKRLKLQLAMAQRIIEHLQKMERLRHAIMKLDQRTIAEIKSYTTPPPVVHTVMTATFLLLRDKERALKDWKSVSVLLSRTGKESFKRRVQDFDVAGLPIEVAERARELLSGLHLDEVRDVSSGVAAFHVWSMGMIEESESRFTQAGGDLSAVLAE